MDIIQTLYSKVWILESWLHGVTGENHETVIASDSLSYVNLLKTTVVATDEGDVPLINSFSQVSHQRELLLHVIQKLRKRNEKNVLTLGFSMASETTNAQVSNTHNLEYLCPNSSFNRLQFPVWMKLLSRVGDCVMEYLLEKMSIFIPVPNASYVQLTGVPVYELWHSNPGKFQLTDKTKVKTGRQTRIVKERKTQKQNKKLCGKDNKLSMNCKSSTGSVPYEQGTNLVNICQKRNSEQQQDFNRTTPCNNFTGRDGPFSVVADKDRPIPMEEDHNRPDLVASTQGGPAPISEEPRNQTNKQKRKKRKKKQACPDFIPYEYHTCIKRTGMLYARNLQDKFNKFFILNSVPCSKEGALSLYRHIFEHNKTIQTPRVRVAWKISEEHSHSICNESSCCSNHSYSIDKQGEQQNDHSSFFNTMSGEMMLPQECCLVAGVTNPNISENKKNAVPQTHDSNDSVLISGETSLHSNQKRNSSSNDIYMPGDRNMDIEIRNEVNNDLPCHTQSFDTSEESCHSQINETDVQVDDLTTSKNMKNVTLQNSLNKSDGQSDFTMLKNPYQDVGTDQMFSSTPLEQGQQADLHIDTSSIIHSDSGLVHHGCSRKGVKRKHLDGSESDLPSKKTCLSTESSDDTSKCNNYFSLQENRIEDQSSDVEATDGQTEEKISDKKITNVDTACVDDKADAYMEVDLHTNISKSENNQQSVKENRLRLTKCMDVGHQLETRPNKQLVNPLSVEVEFMEQLYLLLHQVLINHRKCPYRPLLEYYCPTKKPQRKSCLFQRGKKNFGEFDIFGKYSVRKELHNSISHRQVYLFVRRVCLYILPDQIFGDGSIRNQLCRNLRIVIKSNKYDKICIGQLLSGVKTKLIPWMKCVKSNPLKQHVIAVFWYWIITELVISIVKTFFYVTDTTQHINRLFYYRKHTWRKLQLHAVQDLVKRNILKRIPETSVKQLISQQQSLGVSSLRFLPKQKGLRPIVNLGRQQREFTNLSLSINKQLQNLLQVLTLIKKNHPEVVGAAKFGLDDVYKEWKNFAVKQRDELYFVKTDIKHCYDEILQHKLFSIIQGVLYNTSTENDDYLVRRYVKIFNEGGIIKRKFLRKAFPLGDYKSDFVTFIKHQNQGDNSHHDSVFIDQVVSQLETREQLLRLLHCHVFHNIIKIGQIYYEQSKGISQGSVISTLLCNIYYGDMEKQFPVKQGELMMRIVDDALFVTPSKERAVSYCLQMLKGIPDYNLTINNNKLVTNFDLPESGMTVHQESEWLSWCGVLLNMKTLEATVNLSFYFSSFLKDSMTFDTSNRAGLTMKRKLLRSARLKCHSIYFDFQLNSLNVVIINIFTILVLSVCKFTQYVKGLPRKDNSLFFIGIIDELGHYFYSLYRKTVKHLIPSSKEGILCSEHIQWLCCHAYTLKLNEHRSQYKSIVSALKTRKIILDQKLKKERIQSNFLESVCGNTLPEDFSRIQ